MEKNVIEKIRLITDHKVHYRLDIHMYHIDYVTYQCSINKY